MRGTSESRVAKDGKPKKSAAEVQAEAVLAETRQRRMAAFAQRLRELEDEYRVLVMVAPPRRDGELLTLKLAPVIVPYEFLFPEGNRPRGHQGDAGEGGGLP